jgi:D-galactarolactone cycloisomerase
MAELGASFGARVVPHNCAGPVAFAANLHLCASVPGIRLLEYPLFLAETWDAFGAGHHLGPGAVADGCLPVPDGPGLGVPLDLDAVAAFPYVPPGGRVAGTRQGLPDRFLGDV